MFWSCAKADDMCANKSIRFILFLLIFLIVCLFIWLSDNLEYCHEFKGEKKKKKKEKCP